MSENWTNQRKHMHHGYCRPEVTRDLGRLTYSPRSNVSKSIGHSAQNPCSAVAPARDNVARNHL
jgi:hypothetical protein